MYAHVGVNRNAVFGSILYLNTSFKNRPHYFPIAIMGLQYSFTNITLIQIPQSPPSPKPHPAPPPKKYCQSYLPNNNFMKKEKTIKTYRKPELSLICPPRMLQHYSPEQILTQQQFHYDYNYDQFSKHQSQNLEEIIGVKKTAALTCVDWFKRASVDEQARDRDRRRERDWNQDRDHDHIIELRTQSVLKRKSSKQQHRRFVCKNSPYVKNKEDYERILNNLKPIKGPTDSLMKQIKRHNDQNRKNAENVLLATKDSFKEKIMKYSSRIGLKNNQRIFVMNSKDSHIRQALQQRGWVQSTDQTSTFFHLKWSYTDTPTEYPKLQQGQFFNHFKNNQELTNKNLFRKNIAKQPSYLQPNHPATFDLELGGNQVRFQGEYGKYEGWKILGLLRGVVEGFGGLVRRLERGNCLGLCYGRQKYAINLHLDKASQKRLIKVLQPKKFSCQPKQMQKQRELRQLLYTFCFTVAQFVDTGKQVNVASTMEVSNVLRSMKPWIKKLEDQEIGEDSYQDSDAEIEPSAYQSQKPKTTTKSLLTSILTQDHFLLFLILYLHKHHSPYFSQNFGTENWWIIKPAGVSRGTGIKIERDLAKIMSSKYGKVVQKYIERPLLLACGRKFDIRQWVLVRSFVPMEVYMFRECYCRFSACKYNPGSFHSLSVHLTNYSKQKQTFQRQKNTIESIKSQQELQTEIDKLAFPGKWSLIKLEIKQQIIKSLKACEYEIEDKPECFQVYGFDIILDEEFKPWVLEVNMSPACERRGEFLETCLRDMAEGIVDFVEGAEIRHWERLDVPEDYAAVMRDKKRYSRADEEAAVYRIQRFYRKYLARKRQEDNKIE